jgi:[CysO sulfur-carrier protein]-S-L-cysteine hydrolase
MVGWRLISAPRTTIGGLLVAFVCVLVVWWAPRAQAQQADLRGVMADTRDFTALVVSPELRVVVVERAVQTRPAESVGLLAGVGNRATRYYPATGSPRGARRYAIDPEEQLRLFREIASNGEQMLSIVLSRSQGPAYPSSTDVALAVYPQTVYTFVSLQQEDQPEIRSFHIDRGAIRDVAIVDADEAGVPSPAVQRGTTGAAFLIALAIGLAFAALLLRLRGRAPAPPHCRECQMEMEPAGDMLDPHDPTMRYPMGVSDTPMFAYTRVHVYQCARCAKRLYRRG